MRWILGLIAAVLSAVAVVLLVCMAVCDGYYINRGFDFATGEDVAAKVPRKVSSEPIWVRRFPGQKGLYEKYQLRHDKPVIFYVCGTGYTWYGKARMCWDGYSPYHSFFEILRKFSPTGDEAMEMFARCIAMHESGADKNDVEKYLTERYNHYNDPRMKDLLEKIIKEGRTNETEGMFRDNAVGIAGYLKRHRGDCPPELPSGITLMIQEYCDGDFFLREHIHLPWEKNAVALGLSLLRENSLDEPLLEDAFEELNRAGLLEGWLKTVLPGDLPALPPPVSGTSGRSSFEYAEWEFKDLPCRESALQFRVHGDKIRRHLSEIR